MLRNRESNLRLQGVCELGRGGEECVLDVHVGCGEQGGKN